MRATFTVVCIFLAFCKSFAGYKPFYAAAKSDYDITYHRIELTLNMSTGAITAGKVTTYFKTTVPNVSSIIFDLDGTLTAGTCTYHGSGTTKTQDAANDLLYVTVPTIATVGTLDSVSVNYSGTPPAAPLSGVPSGWNFKAHGSPSQNAIYTLSEPYTGHTWWPCKESLYDKINKVEMMITAPNAYEVAGNGVLTYKVASGASNSVSLWTTNYAISTYMINFAIGNYVMNSSTVTINGTTMPVYNYLYSEDNIAAYQAAINDAKAILPMFSTVFGVPYGFLNEKYGMAECTGSWGALEVQSMTFMARGGGSGYNKTTIAHEIAHQWFGDMVTTNSWHHIWLNEGFAEYCGDVIYYENLVPASLATSRSNLKSSVGSSSTTYVSDTTTPNAIFIGSTSGSQPYEKGAMLLSMLRTYVGDTKFFLGLKNYLTDPAIQYGFGSPALLEAKMEAVSGLDLTNFFSDWIFKKGYPKYVVNYAPINKGIVIQLTQSPSSAGAGSFDTPIPIRITNATGLDTTVIIYDKRGILYNNTNGGTNGTNRISFILSQTPSAISFDPNNLVMATATSIGVNAVLPIHEVVLKATKSATVANLAWKIAADESLVKVVLEKSTDGIHFTALKTWNELVQQDSYYTGLFTDDLRSAVQYYRISAFDKNGSHVYSNIEKVSAIDAVRIQVKPNPATDKIMVTIPASFQDGQLKVVIQNVAGQVVRELEWKRPNAYLMELSTRDLKGGLYNLVLINTNGEQLQTKFIRQ